MRRRIQGLHAADQSAVAEIPDGLFLVRVDRVQYHWHAQKPYYILRFAVLQPNSMAGYGITGRIYCSHRALWKLTWFLRDFGYDTELLGRDEIEEKSLIGLRGVVICRAPIEIGTERFAAIAKWRNIARLLPESTVHVLSQIEKNLT